MPRTLIVASTYEKARNYARSHDYPNADVVGGDVNQLRGRHAERVIIVDELDEKTQLVINPMTAGAEILYATQRSN